MQRFNPSSTQAARAAQAWAILVGMAHNRQTVTYARLARLMYRKEAAGVLANILGHIAGWCGQNGLPQLNLLVVNSVTGKPGDEIPLDEEDFDATREKIYGVDWFDIRPPTEEDFEARVR